MAAAVLVGETGGKSRKKAGVESGIQRRRFSRGSAGLRGDASDNSSRSFGLRTSGSRGIRCNFVAHDDCYRTRRYNSIGARGAHAGNGVIDRERSGKAYKGRVSDCQALGFLGRPQILSLTLCCMVPVDMVSIRAVLLVLAVSLSTTVAWSDEFASLTHASPYVPREPLAGEIRIVG